MQLYLSIHKLLDNKKYHITFYLYGIVYIYDIIGDKSCIKLLLTVRLFTLLLYIVIVRISWKTVFQFNHAASRTDSLRNADNLSRLDNCGKINTLGALYSQTPHEYTYVREMWNTE